MASNIRALLLSAGFGTRLRPLTISTPKCLVQIADKPLLRIWLEKLREVNCSSVIVNTHYLSHKVSTYLDYNQLDGISIECFHEPELLGTAGTLLAHASSFVGHTGLLIHADNLMYDDLHDLLLAHHNRPKDCILTMLTFESTTPSACGIVEVDHNNVVLSFHEKVANPPGNLANGAVYVFDDRLLDFIISLNKPVSDFSLDVLPLLVGKIYTWFTPNPFIDIGTPERLQEAQQLYAHFPMSSL